MLAKTCETCANSDICKNCGKTSTACKNWISQMELNALIAKEASAARMAPLKKAYEEKDAERAMLVISNTVNHALKDISAYLDSYTEQDKAPVIAALRFIANEKYQNLDEPAKALVAIVEKNIVSIKIDISGLKK